jgi:VWFA-related protein
MASGIWNAAATLLALVAATSPTAAQQDRLGNPPRGDADLKVTSRIVQVSVSLTDKETRDPVDGLEAQDFLITDNGHRQNISSFEHGEGRKPLRIVFLIESAGSEEKAVDHLIEALPNALTVLHEVDEVGVASVFPGFHMTLSPTLDRAAVPTALAKVREDQIKSLKAEQSRDKTHRAKMKFDDLNSAIVKVSGDYHDPTMERQLIVVLVSDDFDLLSRSKSGEAAKALLKNGTQVAAFVDVEDPRMAYATTYAHVMTVTTPLGIATRDHGASYYAQMTGGPVIKVEKDNYREAVKRLLESLSRAYQIGFVPQTSAMDGSFHKIAVRVADSNQANHAQLSYRKGYWAKP